MSGIVTYQAQEGAGAYSLEYAGRQSWSVVCRLEGAEDRPIQTKHTTRRDAMSYAHSQMRQLRVVSVVVLEVVCLSKWSRYDE